MADKTIYGDAGYLYIPAVNLRVPLYEKSKCISGQAIVDRENSAHLYRKFRGGCDYIADHASQGFNAIKRCTVGALAFIITKDSTTYYECIEIAKGTNNGNDLITVGGQRVSKTKWADLCCYTCNDEKGKSITMVFFKAGHRVNYPLFKEDSPIFDNCN